MIQKRDGRDIMELLQDNDAIDLALKRGTRDAFVLHYRLKNPVATMRDGKPDWLTREELEEAIRKLDAILGEHTDL